MNRQDFILQLAQDLKETADKAEELKNTPNNEYTKTAVIRQITYLRQTLNRFRKELEE